MEILLSLLQVILIILIIIAILKLFFNSAIYDNIINGMTQLKQNAVNDANKLQLDLFNAKTEAMRNINRAVEESFTSYNNQSSNQSSNNDSVNANSANANNSIVDISLNSEILAGESSSSMGENISYINRSNKVKLELYYKTSCPYCQDFMPIWTKIINELPNDAYYEEIDCDMSPSRANTNKITSVPSIILMVDNEKKVYMGNRSYEDISRFLRVNGVNLIKRTFEDFNNGITTNNPTTNSNCPAVTFDKQIDLEKDLYMYQIFSADGQYGYATGGYKSDKLLTPFQAAYSTIDSYLSSLPDDSDPTKSSYKNINKCAKQYSSQIINFGVCDEDQLNTIKEYKSNVANGISSIYIDGTDYNGNEKVVNAISQACGF
jgi:thiol-disulfide isomerase/thioredoxin